MNKKWSELNKTMQTQISKKESFEKGKEINQEWNDDELSYLINNCVNIENTLSDINEIKWKINT